MQKAQRAIALLLLLSLASMSDLNPLLLWEPWRAFLNSLSPKFLLPYMMFGLVIGLKLLALSERKNGHSSA